MGDLGARGDSQTGSGRTSKGVGKEIRESKMKQGFPDGASCNERFLAAFEFSAVGMLCIDAGDGRLNHVNPAFAGMLGYSPQELIGTRFPELVDEADRPSLEKFFGMLREKGGRGIETELRFAARDGTELIGQTIGTTVSDEAGHYVCTQLQVIDVTECRRARDEAMLLLAQNRMLVRERIRSADNERRYLAHELHDELGQSLTYIDTLATLIATQADEEKIAGHAQEISANVRHVFELVRGMLNRIRPHKIDTLGLSKVLQDLVSQWQKSTGIACSLDVTDDMTDFKDDTIGITVYRLVQETLTNAARHADADRVSVRLAMTQPGPDASGAVTVVVRDNGRGMDISKSSDLGLGMIGMRERVMSLGGECRFSSAPGQGMQVEASIPLRPQQDAGIRIGAPL